MNMGNVYIKKHLEKSIIKNTEETVSDFINKAAEDKLQEAGCLDGGR